MGGVSHAVEEVPGESQGLGAGDLTSHGSRGGQRRLPGHLLSARLATESEGLGTRAPRTVGPTLAPAGGGLLGQRVPLAEPLFLISKRGHGDQLYQPHGWL